MHNHKDEIWAIVDGTGELLITGFAGQDGSYMVRRRSVLNTERIDHVKDKLHLYEGDLTDSSCLNYLISDIKTNEICKSGALKVGNLDLKRDFSDIRYVVRAYRMVIESENAYEIYNRFLCSSC